MTGSAPPRPASARARARVEITAAILDTARRHLAETGAGGLSLRAVAREVGMVSSAVYRYFPSRDDLLTALIVEAYASLGDAADVADSSCRRADRAGRFAAIGRAVWTWAAEHPHEYALLYGTPVPGYQAPPDTVDPGTRVSRALLAVVVEAWAAGELASQPWRGGAALAPSVRHDLDVLRAQGAADVPDDVLLRGLAAWTGVFGLVSFLLYGQFTGLVSDREAYVDAQLRSAWRSLAAR